MYTESFPGHIPEFDQQTRNEAKNQLIQLRSSNILMGNAIPDYRTMHSEDFVRISTLL